MSIKEWSTLENYIETFMQNDQIPGMAIAIEKDGKTIYERGFGYRNLKTKELVTPNTVFGIASITKSMSALAIMKLVEIGKVDLNSPVTTYIPEFKFPSLPNKEEVKVHHLLTHTTGQPPMKRREELTSFDEHLQYISNKELKLLGSPGEFISYCNDTFLLLGAIIERVTGESYEQYVTNTILQPLDMQRSTFNIEEVKELDDVSTPYVKNEQIGIVQEVPWPRLGNYTVGGGVRSCVRDLIKYGKLLTDRARFGDMWKGHHQIMNQVYYGYALEVTETNAGITFVKHGGSQAGVSAHFGFVPEENLTVAVLSNLAKVPIRKVWLAAVNHVLEFPLTESHVSDKEEHLTEKDIQKLLGEYYTDEYGRCVISQSDGQIYAEFEMSERLILHPVNRRTLRVDGDDSFIQFYFKNENETAWAFLHQRRMWVNI